MTNITISVNTEDETPIYEQIESQIIELLARRVLKPGDQLPSIRELAAMLGVNMLTVNKAYNSLVRDGYLAVVKKRYVVRAAVHDTRWKEMIMRAIYRALASNASPEEVAGFVSSAVAKVSMG